MPIQKIQQYFTFREFHEKGNDEAEGEIDYPSPLSGIESI